VVMELELCPVLAVLAVLKKFKGPSPEPPTR
jgi:hypothetical protein